MPFCTVHRYADKADWLQHRHTLKGVGGSDAGVVAGVSKWKTAHELWEEKTGRRAAPDLDSNESVQFGARAEEYIRALWTLKNAGRYEMHYAPYCIVQNNADKGLLYSPDGLLKECGTKRLGIWECKTTTIKSAVQAREWRNSIPETYLMQVLHGSNVMPLISFVVLTAFITWADDKSELIDYTIEISDYLNERQELKETVLDFYYRNLQEDIEPPRYLPMI